MSKVIVFGSLNMDFSIQSETYPKKGETIEGHDFVLSPGGKGGNQAVASAKLGAQVYMIACVGDDIFGKQIIKAMEDSHVNCNHIMTYQELPTGVALITCTGGDNRIIISPGTNYYVRISQVKEALNQVAEQGDIFITQLECDKETVTQSIIEAKKRHMYTIFNPAPAKEIEPSIFSEIDLLIVNQTECEFYTGIFPEGEDSLKAATQVFESLGVSQVIITLGEKGSVLKNQNEVLYFGAHKVKIVDTTAAGDTFIGAIAGCLANGKSLIEGISFASKAAAVKITKRGAQSVIPTIEEVENYFKEGYNESFYHN